MLVLFLRDVGVDQLAWLDVLAVEIMLRDSFLVMMLLVRIGASATIICDVLRRLICANDQLFFHVPTVLSNYLLFNRVLRGSLSSLLLPDT